MLEEWDLPADDQEQLVQFEELFKQFREPLIVEAYCIVKSWGAAEDIVQDTFITIWERNYLAGVAPNNFRSYLFRSVKNNCVTYLREDQKAQKKKDKYMETAPKQEGPNPAITWEIRQRINQAILELPEQRRMAFIKAHMEQKTYREVGTEMGLKMETVRSHVKIALKNLRAILKNLK